MCQDCVQTRSVLHAQFHARPWYNRAVKATTPKLSIEQSRTPEGIEVLRIWGEASVGDVPLLERAVTRLSAGMPERFVLDLTGLAFASSLAIGQIMSLLNTARIKRTRAAVACVGDIHGILLRSRANLMAPLRASVDSALAAVADTPTQG